jgi:pilus assembly protein CpaC
MHRTMSRFLSLAGGFLLALLVSALPAAAQDRARGSALIVPLNGTQRLQMTTKKPISRVVNAKENAVNIRTVVGDPTTILVIGQQPDVTRIELTDVDGKTEAFDVIVQADVEYLRTQLIRAVPTANVTPIPASNNTVILAGTVTRAEDIPVVLGVVQSVGFQAINALRVGGVQQVQLDVVVARVARSDMRSMAFNFLTNSRAWYLGSTVGNAVGEPPIVGVGSSLNATFNGAQALAGAPGAPNGVPTNILFGVLHNRAGFLSFLEALRAENLAKFIAEPRLVTLSGRPASFLDGGEQAVPVPAGLGQVGVQFEEFGTRLNFIPIVLGNGRIHLEVEPEVSQLDAAAGTNINGTVVPGRITSRINTTVELEPGQTFVIGGLIQNLVTASAVKVPVLGDIPFLGAAFSSKMYQESEQEVIVLVTPYLVDGQSCDQRPQILPGMETRRPDDFELFLEGIIEAPRGPREVCQDHHYVAPYKNSPSAAQYPCVDGRGGGSCGNGGCLGSHDLTGPVEHASSGLPVPNVPSVSNPAATVTPANPAAPTAPPPVAARAAEVPPLPGSLGAISEAPVPRQLPVGPVGSETLKEKPAAIQPVKNDVLPAADDGLPPLPPVDAGGKKQ